jgi:hypothetical protein
MHTLVTVFEEDFKPRGPNPCFEVKYRAIPLMRKRVRHSTRGPLGGIAWPPARY